jgi:hypothetical protein
MQARRGCRDGNKCFKTRGECAIVPRETVELLDLGTEYFDEISTYMHVVCGPLRQESNLYLALRRRPFYPLNYEEIQARIVAAAAFSGQSAG